MEQLIEFYEKLNLNCDKIKDEIRKLKYIPTKSLKLYEFQESHVSNLKHILKTHTIALDFSMMGTGKTFTSTAIASEYSSVIVICPGIMKHKWTCMKEYGLPLIHCITYPALRGACKHQPKHPYLRKINEHYFVVTEEYIKLVKSGVFLIVDEIQNLKNSKSSQFKACMSLVSKIHKSTKSKCLFLSGTPIDKVVQCVALFQLMGIMKHCELAKSPAAFKAVEWTGLSNLYNRAIELSSQKIVDELLLKSVVGHNKENAETRGIFAYLLFQNIFKPAFKSSMLPDQMPFKLHSYDGKFILEDKYRNKLSMLIAEGNIVIYEGNDVYRLMTRILRLIEIVKMRVFIRIVKKQLAAHKTCKVMLCLNYTTSIEYASEQLKDFSPVILNGETPMKMRVAITEKFQEPNLNCRVIIGNPKVMATGIDLDDKHGQFPRFAYISPCYNINELHQVSYRIMRADTKSDATLFYVYVKDEEEIKIIESLIDKGHVMSTTTDDQHSFGVKFPGEFDEFVEEK